MGEQVAQRRRAFHRHRDQPARGVAARAHPQFGELGQVPRDRIVEGPAPFVPKQEHGDCGHRFRHREQPVQIVDLGACLGTDVTVPQRRSVTEPPVPSNQHDRACDGTVVDVRLDRRIHRRQPVAGETDHFGLRVGPHQISPDRAIAPRWWALGFNVRANVS